MLGRGVKSRICRHTRLRCPDLIQTRSQRGPAELANKPITLKPTCWKPQMLVGWLLQHHLQQRCAAKHANLPGGKGVRGADHQDGREDRPAPFAQHRRHNAGRCACHRPPAALGTANARSCFNEPFLWGAESAVPPTALCSFSPPLQPGSSSAKPCQNQGHHSLCVPLRSPFTPRQASVALRGPPGGTGGETCSLGEW